MFIEAELGDPDKPWEEVEMSKVEGGVVLVRKTILVEEKETMLLDSEGNRVKDEIKE